MVSSSRTESLAQRFAAYIDELHEFFRSRGVPFGTKQDLETFPTRLQDPSFQEEMVSMVRSIVYSENEAIPRTDLADLLAIALAGPEMEDAAASPVLSRPLLDFVTGVLHAQRFTLSPEPAEEDHPAPAASAVVPSEPLPLRLVDAPGAPPAPLEPPQPMIATAPAAAYESAPEPDNASAVPTNDRLSRALIASEAPETFGKETSTKPASVPATEHIAPVTTAAEDRPTARRAITNQPAYPPQYPTKPRSAASFFRNAYWLPGLCALLLVLGAAFFLRRPHAPPPPPAAAQPPYAATAQPAKPSAYGPLLKDSRSHRQPTESAGTGSTSPAPPPVSSPANEVTSEPHSLDRHLADNLPGNPTRRMTPLASSRVTPRVLGGREGVFLASSGAMAAHLLAAPAPHYPKLASLTHVEGEVIVQVVVGRDGGVEATRSLEGPLLLRGAAEHAIRHWRYRPYLVDGKPTDVATIVTVNFRLTH